MTIHDASSWKALRAPWGRCRVTTREQTVLDCLGRTSFAGGVEEAVRSLKTPSWLDIEQLAVMAAAEGPVATSRVGWLLEQKKDDWYVDDGVLAELEGTLGPGPHRLGYPGPAGTHGWSARWKLMLPDTNAETAIWVTH